MKKTILAVILGLAVLIGGYFLVSGGPATKPPATQAPMDQTAGNGKMVMMDSSSFYFSPKEIQTNVGQPITVHVTAQGRHTFTIDELGVNVETSSGQTTPVTFTPDKKGVFTFYCAVPGHKENGQTGTITVE